MPDHVHLILTPLKRDDQTWHSLPELLQSIKSFTAHEIQRRRGNAGAFWQEEYFDRIIRDDEEYVEKWNYVWTNALRKGLVHNPEEYEFSVQPLDSNGRDARSTSPEAGATEHGRDARATHNNAARSLTLLLAEGITNVDNMGALFRNAAAFGVDGIVLDPTCCDPLYRKAIRVSMGHVLSIPYAVCESWPDDLRRLKQEWGITLIAAESTAQAIPLWRMPKHHRVGILFGSEGHGLSGSALEHCDAVCAIPMSGDVPSINVAVASSVMLYELRRPV